MTEKAAQEFGASLRFAREQRGLTLRQIADASKLSVRTLDALETNRIKILPGGIYRRAIVRVYAEEVGLDPETTLRAFLAQHPDDLPETGTAAAVVTAPPPVRSKWHTILSLCGALIPIIAGVLFFTLSARGSDAPGHVVDIMPTRTVKAWRPEIGPEAALIAASSTEARSISMMISVSSRTFLDIVADGRQVVDRHVDAGELVRLDLASDVVLQGDNAGAVHFSINGRAGRALGTPNVPLNVRIARDGYQDWLIQP